jgi:hypothetical protein
VVGRFPAFPRKGFEMDKYVVVVLCGDYGEFVGVYEVEAGSADDAEVKVLSKYRELGSNYYAHSVVKGEVVSGSVEELEVA